MGLLRWKHRDSLPCWFLTGLAFTLLPSSVQSPGGRTGGSQQVMSQWCFDTVCLQRRITFHVARCFPFWKLLVKCMTHWASSNSQKKFLRVQDRQIMAPLIFQSLAEPAFPIEGSRKQWASRWKLPSLNVFCDLILENNGTGRLELKGITLLWFGSIPPLILWKCGLFCLWGYLRNLSCGRQRRWGIPNILLMDQKRQVPTAVCLKNLLPP